MTTETEEKVENLTEPEPETASAESDKAEDTISEDFSPAEAPEATAAQPVDRQKVLEQLLSMPVPVIVKLAQKKMTLSRVLQLKVGSVVQFDKDAYQHVDLMVNNHTIGLGQPVKIGEHFGLRIIEIGQVEKVIKSLGGIVE